MKSKTKNALLFGGLILFNCIVVIILTEDNSFSGNNIISTLIASVAGGYIFGFILKGSFEWKNKKKEINK
jgi:hypothetical protein